ncbi:MAG: class I adenylate-forming enzyme family protein [Pseudomonadota bacterium]
MKAIQNTGPFAPCPAPFNLAAHVLGQAERVADKDALVQISDTGNTSLTYDALRRSVLGIGTGLSERGMEPGDRVLMRLGNTVDFPLAYLGAIAVGIVPVPTSSALTETEVAAIAAQIKPKLTLRDPDVACPETLPSISPAELDQMKRAPAASYDMGDPNRLAYMIYTSGTSGRPRAVMHAHRAIWARRMMIDDWYGLDPADRMLHAGAFNWTYTLGTGLMDPWTVGATALIPAPRTPPEALLRMLADHRATIFAAAPGVYRQMLRYPVPGLPDLRHGLSAGEKLPHVTEAAWQDATQTPIFEAYGMSECSTFISGNPAHPAPAGTLGRPQRGRHIAILAEGAPAETGQPGIIAVHRSDPGLMLGYLDQPEETASRLRGDWFLTGDQGEMDAGGHIRFLGRADDMMNAGGFRVSPLEVEAAMAAFPGISAIGVTDVPVSADATIIAAFYVSEDSLSECELQAFAADRLARYKQPRAYVQIPDLPKGANGKILRRKLRDYWKASHD